MKSVILCGGKGTRIKDVSQIIPKPMLKIGPYPILWHIMNHYAYYNYKEFVLCLGYLGWEIKSYFLNFKNMVYDLKVNLSDMNIEYQNGNDIGFDWSIIMAETGEETLTGGRIYQIKKYVENDDLFMLTYGDGLSDINISQLVKYHKKHGKIGTVTGVRPAGRFGEIESNDFQQIIEFNEKPQTTSGRINGGFFVFDAKRIWNYLNDDPTLTFEQEPLKEMAKDGELMMFPHDGFWQPMDTYREYIMLNRIWNTKLKAKEVPWQGQLFR